MAFFDESQDNIVIRIVYVGPPFAGKTESLRVLSQILKGRTSEDYVYSPEDLCGRTLYFDWFDHCAGLFQGNPIRCQIITVPGQTHLADRRKMLVDMADCLIFVGDSTPLRWKQGREYLVELLPWLKASQPPIGIVFQLNKQDHPEAYPVDAFRKVLSELDYPNPVIQPTTAISGKGLREAFVLAVRFALDRVHALIEAKALRSGESLDISDGQHLFDLMTRDEQGFVPSQEENSPSDVALTLPTPGPDSLKDSKDHTPTPKTNQGEVTCAAGSNSESHDAHAVMKSLTSHVIAGGIYPPVRGRERMHAAVVGLQLPELLPDGSWFADTDEWVMRSRKDEMFSDLTSGRQYLLALAQRCELLKDVLTRERFITVTELAGGDCLVWQGVKKQKGINEGLEQGGQESDLLESATLVFHYATKLYRFLGNLAGRHEDLALSGLDGLVIDDDEMVFAGFVEGKEKVPDESISSLQQVTHLLAPHLSRWPEVRRMQISDSLNGRLRDILVKTRENEMVLDALVALLRQATNPIEAMR